MTSNSEGDTRDVMRGMNGNPGTPGKWFRRIVFAVTVFSLLSAAFLGGRWYEDHTATGYVMAELELGRSYQHCTSGGCRPFQLFELASSVDYPGGRI